MKRPSCVSLYSGAGGLDLGLRNAGFDVIFANDIIPLFKESYTHPSNFGSDATYHVGSATEVNADLILQGANSKRKSVALLAGGPPCPPYSKSRFYRKEKPRGVQDPVGEATLSAYLRVLEELRPQAFLFENVHGFAYEVHADGLNTLEAAARRLGYQTNYTVINAADYGVPQIRMRFFMVGMRNKKFAFPAPTHADLSKTDDLFSSSLRPWRTCGDVLTDLDTEENASDSGHFAGGQYNHLLREIPPGDNYLFFTEKRGHPEPVFKWRSRYWSFLLKLSPKLPSWTLQARRSNNMGPFHWRSRILRIAEVKRLQTFPDDWYLAGKTEDQWRQLGNAVPPLLAETLGRAILAQL